MEEYTKQLLKDAGMPDDLDEEVRSQLIRDLTIRAEELINRRLIDSMSDIDASAFSNLIDEQPDNIDAMQRFITDHVPDKKRIVGSALLEFRALYLGSAA